MFLPYPSTLYDYRRPRKGRDLEDTETTRADFSYRADGGKVGLLRLCAR